MQRELGLTNNFFVDFGVVPQQKKGSSRGILRSLPSSSKFFGFRDGVFQLQVKNVVYGHRWMSEEVLTTYIKS